MCGDIYIHIYINIQNNQYYNRRIWKDKDRQYCIYNQEPATNKKNRHGIKKIIVNKEKVGKVQTPSSVFRSGSIFSNNDDDNISV